MKTLLVTGGIGSGKSAVSAYLSSKGCPVYDSDSRAKSLYDTSPPLLQKLVQAFGEEIIDADGHLDRKLLASMVFGRDEALKLLNSIVHPAVLEDFLKWRSAQKDADMVVIESALALSDPLFRAEVDAVLLVDAPLELRVSRACERDSSTRDEVLARAAAQGFDFSLVDVVVPNVSGLDDLYSAVDSALERLLMPSR